MKYKYKIDILNYRNPILASIYISPEMMPQGIWRGERVN